jgi:MFS family permease
VVAVVAGLVSSLFAKETRSFAAMESARGSLRAVVSRVSWSHPPLRAVSAGGLVNNLNDGMSWGLFPLFFVSRGSTLQEAATLVAVYPAVWGLGQLVTGFLSDRYGRKWLMASGMALQGLALIGVAAGHRFTWWLAGMVLLGAGTALVYPTFLSAVSDHSDPGWRASAIGVYRWWRDLGYALGAVIGGGVADLFGIPASIALVGALTVATGVVIATTYEERESQV